MDRQKYAHITCNSNNNNDNVVYVFCVCTPSALQEHPDIVQSYLDLMAAVSLHPTHTWGRV